MSASATDVRERPASRETTYEVEQFLYEEAELLDQWRLHEWLELRPFMSEPSTVTE